MKKRMSFKRGDIVRFMPELQDAENEYDFILIEDMGGGRVKVMPLNTGLEFPPVQVVKTEWIYKVN